jgi:hypothetical protein
MRTSILLVAAVLGCGGGGGVSVGDLPDSIDDNRCDRLVACQGVQDRETCEAATQFDAEGYGSIEAGVKDGTIKYDSGAAADCADSFGDKNCNFTGFHFDDPCEKVFTGTVATGGACVIDLQCANGGDCVYAGGCDPETMCCTGTCMGGVMTMESAIGGPCDDELHFCGTNAFCKQGTGAGPGTCTALIAMEGAACDQIDACSNPMYCNLNLQTGAGTCKKAPGSNAACSRMDLLPCSDARDYCDATTMTCTRDVAVGGTCGPTVQCVEYASCINGACVADLPLGATCTTGVNNAQCAVDLECVAGTCSLPAVTNMTCMLPQQ